MNDCFNLIKESTKWFVNNIIITIRTIHSLVSSDKYIKKNHKLLDKFDDSKDEFEFEG